MFESTASDIYFAVGIMVLAMIITVSAVYLFVRLYRKEKAANQGSEQAEKKNPEDQ